MAKSTKTRLKEIAEEKRVLIEKIRALREKIEVLSFEEHRLYNQFPKR